MSTPYPARPQFFANELIRHLAQSGAANEIGAPACWLITVVVMTEDARRYDGPVTFYNGQLAEKIGANSVDTLDRIREKAVKAGWLNYRPGASRRPGEYFATLPNDALNLRGSIRTGAERSAELDALNLRTGAERSADDRDSFRTSFRTGAERSAEPSSPIPKTQPKDTEARALDDRFAEFWTEYPRKEAKGAAERAWRKLNPSPDLFAAIIAAVRAQKVHGCLEPRSDATGRSFIPHPATWLNARRWEDTPPPAGQPAQRMDHRTAYAVDTLRDCFPEE